MLFRCVCINLSPVVVVTAGSGATEADGGVVLHVCQLGLSELQSRDPALPDDVVHLLGDGGVIQWGQEGEGLEEPACGAHSISPTQSSAACL